MTDFTNSGSSVPPEIQTAPLHMGTSDVPVPSRIASNLEDSNPHAVGEQESAPVPDPFDPASLRLSPNADNPGVVFTRKLINIACDKPKKQDWVRVHPSDDFWMDAGILEDSSSTQEKYLVAPVLFDELSRYIRRCRIMLATTRHEKPFLWPATIPDPNGREMACHRSMLEAQTTAIHQWTQVCWNAPKSDYDVDTATADLGEPKWPTESFRDLLELCFRGRLLNDMDHPFIQQLLGKI